ncbi:uncharacterized protein LOC131624017 [Vicia villosa]|uniref:uncharacterized protein LOC131624017 n=1 Tax=Vicia villosa TaxID=3911 RepID=UPI00273B520A|nr:uncharacterized protein LOC131624017 [Vicia villosa]
MIVFDKYGNHIHVVVPSLYSKTFDSQLALNDTVTISNFQVLPNDVVFKPTQHKYLLKFSGGTTVGDRNKHSIPDKVVQVTLFCDIISGKWKKDVLIGNYYGQKYPLSVSNTYNVTKLYINDDLKTIKDFMNSIPKDYLAIRTTQLGSQSQVWSQNSGSSYLTPYQKFMAKTFVLPLKGIKELNIDTFCITIAKINKLIASKYGWYYQACHQCPKVSRGDKPPFKCDAEHLSEYKTYVEVVHGGAKCKFVLWDRESEQSLEVSAAQMRDSMIEGDITDPLEYPLAVDKLLGKEVAYKLKWQPMWYSCLVISIFEDIDVIKQLKETCGEDGIQIKESVDKAHVTDDSEVITETEITSKLNSDPITPTTKRSNPDWSSESTTTFNLADGELPSNKLNKLIKIEK